MVTAPALPIADLPAAKLPKLSQYRVRALLQCSAWEPSRAGSPEFQYGHAFHAAAELAVRDGLRDPREVADLAITGTPGFPLERTDELRAMVRTWLSQMDWDELSGWEVATEVSLERTVDRVAVLTGRADRIDISRDGRILRLPDYKTAWLGEREKQPSFQLMYYAFLAARRWLGAESFRLELHGVRTNTVQSWTLSLDDIEGWGEQMSERLALVLRSEKRPTGSLDACRGCAKRYGCGSAVSAAAHRPDRDDQLPEIVSDIIRLKAAVTERELALKDYLRNRDPLLIGGLRVGYVMTAPSIRLVDKDRALAEGLAKATKPGVRFSMSRARNGEDEG